MTGEVALWEAWNFRDMVIGIDEAGRCEGVGERVCEWPQPKLALYLLDILLKMPSRMALTQAATILHLLIAYHFLLS